jgi:hypothetical protein
MAASGKRDGTSNNAASPLLGNAEHTARDWNLHVLFYYFIILYSQTVVGKVIKVGLWKEVSVEVQAYQLLLEFP